MAILDFIKKQFIDIIEWTDDSRDTLSYRFPDEDKEIKNGAQLIVRESQAAQFVYLGEFGDTTGTVVATGGGAVLHRQIWRELRKNATIVWLTADTAILMQRICKDDATKDNRPSLTGKGVAEELAQILKEREPLYRELAQFTVDTGRLKVVEAVDYIYERAGKILE